MSMYLNSIVLLSKKEENRGLRRIQAQDSEAVETLFFCFHNQGGGGDMGLKWFQNPSSSTGQLPAFLISVWPLSTPIAVPLEHRAQAQSGQEEGLL